MQRDWQRWPTITLISGTSKSKTAMACSPPSFRSFLPNPILVTTSCPSYIQTTVAACRNPDVGALKKCLADMLSLPGQGQIYIIVDALDECPNFLGTPSAREDVLEFVKEIDNLNRPNVNICEATMPETEIRLVLEPFTTHKISLHDEIGQKKDIVEYINSIICSDWNMQRWNEDDKQLVVDTLSCKADGM